MLSVYFCDTGISLRHKPIDKKTNEIPAAQEVLGIMGIEGMIVTADTMNCQKETAAVIHEEKREYVLVLKGNQGLFDRSNKLDNKVYITITFCGFIFVFITGLFSGISAVRRPQNGLELIVTIL